MATTLRIARQFHGPPDSGNGGYVCGCLARFIHGPATVRLKAPRLWTKPCASKKTVQPSV